MINPAKMVGFMLTYNATKIRSSELVGPFIMKLVFFLAESFLDNRGKKHVLFDNMSQKYVVYEEFG